MSVCCSVRGSQRALLSRPVFFVFKMKRNVFLYTLILYMLILIIKINNFRGNLTDILAEEASLAPTVDMFLQQYLSSQLLIELMRTANCEIKHQTLVIQYERNSIATYSML